MRELPAALFRAWLHSYEEDHDDVTVFRPEDHPFPPARGRRGMEFAPDGSFADHPVGRGDAPDTVRGRWRAVGDRRVAVSFEGARAGRVLEIVRCDEDVLEVRTVVAQPPE
ncbi:hypothetical protein ACIBBD_33460 [Streptomyces sp. NPDC051315]|uniref:hypothetical protein n=1 Tax=Streptomyces sp. NPDC051315 TaxID=3365650 RepID=UPI0037BA4EF0